MIIHGLSFFHEGKIGPEAGACSTALTPPVRLWGHLGPSGHVCELGVGRVQLNQNSSGLAQPTTQGMQQVWCLRPGLCVTQFILMQVETDMILN